MEKKKIDVKQALLLFISIHILIAWVAERKKNNTEQLLLKLPSVSESTTENNVKLSSSTSFENGFIYSLNK